jgi:hypothetical protein
LRDRDRFREERFRERFRERLRAPPVNSLASAASAYKSVSLSTSEVIWRKNKVENCKTLKN